MRIQIQIMEPKYQYNNGIYELSRVPAKYEYIVLTDGMVVEVEAVFHQATPGQGESVALVRTTVVG